VVLIAAMAVTARADPVVAAFERFHRDQATVEGGLLLLSELNCVACHAAPAGWRERVPGRGKISLAGVGSRLQVEALRAFVGDPHSMKPGTTMPGTVPDDPGAANAIAAYLATLMREEKKVAGGDVTAGKKVFESVGCVACHVASDAAENGRSVPIGLAQHYTPEALVAFLLDPLQTRPGGRMPKTELSVREAVDLAAYLQRERTIAGESARREEGEVERGRREFLRRNCTACHETGDPAMEIGRVVRGIAALWSESGCLAPEPRAGVPRFGLSDVQRSSLRLAIEAMRTRDTPERWSAERRVVATFEQLNCYACHEWRGRGGVTAEGAKFFAATDAAAESLGEIGHLPPNLDQAGRKLSREWLEKLLWGTGGGVRPYMTARMPKFGEAAAASLVGALEEACRPVQPQEIDVSGGKGHQRFGTGRTLLGTGTGGLGCVACHGVKSREPSGVRAVNLTHTAQRLRPEYFKALLLDPQGVQPGTIMPPLFAGRANADKEIESIWTYFKELDQSEVLPEGLAVAGSFELKPEVEGRPIVFRTFLEHAGTQAIAVGFPEGVHVAFDAFEVRWALAWRGRFIDAQQNWEERPMKPVKALGEPKKVLPPVLAVTRAAEAGTPPPRTFGAYAGYRFKGYRIEKDGVPVFRYTVNGIDVEDTMRPLAGGGGLKRTVVLRGGGEGWLFQGAGEGVAPRPVEWRGGVASFEEEVRW
jgi:cytochrome c2